MNFDTEYGSYRQLAFPDADSHPQRQGFSPETYEQIVQEPSTTLQIVRHEGQEVRVPQLTRYTADPWLNSDFYDKKYGGIDTAYLHASETMILSDSTKERLRELSLNNGVMLFDVPSCSVEGLAGTIRSLRSNDIYIESVDLLGTQTYLEGEVRVKKERFSKVRALHLNDTFYSVIDEDGIGGIGADVRVDTSDGAWVYRRLEENNAKILYNFYSDAYKVLNDSPLRQGLDPETFIDMVSRNEEVAKLIFSKNGNPQTVFLATAEIDSLDWVNSSYYRTHFSEDYENNNLLWFPGIATDPEARTMSNGLKLTKLLIRLAELGGYAPRLVFDFCDFNMALGLHKVLEKWTVRSGAELDLNIIADHKFYSATLK